MAVESVCKGSGVGSTRRGGRSSSLAARRKGVMLDHANLDAMAEMGRQALHIGRTDGLLLILPLFHVNGIVVSVLMPLLAGASVVMAEADRIVFRPRRS